MSTERSELQFISVRLNRRTMADRKEKEEEEEDEEKILLRQQQQHHQQQQLKQRKIALN